MESEWVVKINVESHEGATMKRLKKPHWGWTVPLTTDRKGHM